MKLIFLLFIKKMMENLKQLFIKYKQFFLYFFISLVILLILVLIYLLERYIIYNIIYYFLNLFHIYFFSTILESILLLVYLHIIFARLIILSIIFPSGGFLKKIFVYEEFCPFIDKILDIIEQLVTNINRNTIKNSESFINQLNEFKITSDIIKNFNYLGIEQYIIDITELFNDYKINQQKEAKEKLKKLIKEFHASLIYIQNISFTDFIFKFKTKESLILMENYMLNMFSSHKIEKINITKDFDIYLLSPKVIEKNNNILSIFCNQNGLCCEFYSVYPDNIYYYLNTLNCHIIIWNYKGFGLRKGFTTFGSVNKDIDILSNYIKNNFNKFKIIIHGCSIGGYSSIILAQKLLELNIVLISDRTFSDIRDIVKTMSFNKLLTFIYDIIFPKLYFKYRNIENYINIPADKKIILFDANDEIIPYEPSSLVFGLTKKYYNDKVKPVLIKYKEFFILKKTDNKEILEELINLNSKTDNIDNNSFIFIQKLVKFLKSGTLEQLLMFFIIFAYPFNKYKEIFVDPNEFYSTYMKIPDIMKTIIEKNKIILSDKLIELISTFNYLFFKYNLISDLNDVDILKFNYNNNINISIEQNRINDLKRYLGYVHRINCGHDGKLSIKDFEIIIELLNKNKFLLNNY